jgi:mannose-1-phosphate guanylyltransferase
MKPVAVIMAGGKGERFWPKSRKNMPKQFLSLTTDGKTMIQHTVERLLPLVTIEDIFIVTNKDYKYLIMEQLPNILEDNIVLEPMAKNTAPCIGFAATYIRKKYNDAVMLVLPSDHLIKYNDMFIDTLRDGIEIAKQDKNMVTIGITPSYPETGYGYINLGKDARTFEKVRAYEVERFVEKPSVETAKEYLASGRYLWNSGIFIWKVSTILSNFEKLLPDTYIRLAKIEQSIGTKHQDMVIETEFRQCISESIDYAIMEKAENIYTLPGNFGWDDVGSWLALERINMTNEYGNVVTGNVVTIDMKNSIIQAGDKLVATIGLENIVVVDTNDALLICNKSHVQDIKKITENLKICNRNKYL